MKHKRRLDRLAKKLEPDESNRIVVVWSDDERVEEILRAQEAGVKIIILSWDDSELNTLKGVN